MPKSKRRLTPRQKEIVELASMLTKYGMSVDTAIGAAEMHIPKLPEPEVPIRKLRELFLSAADLVDGDQDDKIPSYLSEAYLAVFNTKWGQKVYSDAVEQANKGLELLP